MHLWRSSNWTRQSFAKTPTAGKHILNVAVLYPPPHIGHVHPHPLKSSLLPTECALLLRRGVFNSPRKIGFPSVTSTLAKPPDIFKINLVCCADVFTAARICPKVPHVLKHHIFISRFFCKAQIVKCKNFQISLNIQSLTC